MINLHTKFEVSIFTHYEDMKSNTTYKILDGLRVRSDPRSPAMSPFDRAPITFYSLFDFNRNYVSILYSFRVIATYLSKVADFNLPHLHLAPR